MDVDFERLKKAYQRWLHRAGDQRVIAQSLGIHDLIARSPVHPLRVALAREVLASDWLDFRSRAALVRHASHLFGGVTLPARLAADYASRVPQGPVGRRAIEAARRWADDPTEHNRAAAQEAFSAATATEATEAAEAASAAAAADTHYMVASREAAWAARYAAARVGDAASEHVWQQERLALYLVSPDWPSPVPDAP